jgi:hypothetical protein
MVVTRGYIARIDFAVTLHVVHESDAGKQLQRCGAIAHDGADCIAQAAS